MPANVFELRDRIIADYSSYARSFIRISDDRINALVKRESDGGMFSPIP